MSHTVITINGTLVGVNGQVSTAAIEAQYSIELTNIGEVSND